jgi:predicted DNA repair protein MutK
MYRRSIPLAGSSLLALLDDIATLLDDVSAMTGVAAKKTAVAAKKTAGVLGDDLALNAQQVSGVSADRELPVVWAVFKGSAVNKTILVPCALLLSAFLPWLITPLLMLGGAFLCYEGFEKVAHALLHTQAEDDADHEQRLDAVMDPGVDMVEFERQRIKGAIRTDAILSAEIIVIALGTVQDSPMGTQIAVLSAIAVLMTIGVYGLVAAIVKLDDAGLHLLEQSSRAKQAVGAFILRLAPRLMKSLSVLGTRISAGCRSSARPRGTGTRRCRARRDARRTRGHGLQWRRRRHRRRHHRRRAEIIRTPAG